MYCGVDLLHVFGSLFVYLNHLHYRTLLQYLTLLHWSDISKFHLPIPFICDITPRTSNVFFPVSFTIHDISHSHLDFHVGYFFTSLCLVFLRT